MRSRSTGRWLSWVLIVPALMLGLLDHREGNATHANALTGGPLTPWVPHIRMVDDARPAGRPPGVGGRLHRDARNLVVGGPAAAGDPSLRIGQLSGSRKAAEAKARQLYLATLLYRVEAGP